MPRSRRAYYWLIMFLIPCMLGIDQCGTRLFLTGEATKSSPTEPCVEYIATPTPVQILSPPGDPEPQNTPLIQDGEVIIVVTPTILPTPVISGNFIVSVYTLFDFFCGGSAGPPTGDYEMEKGDTMTLWTSPLFTCNYAIYVDGVAVVGPGFMGSGSYVLTVTKDHSVYVCASTGPC